jgi:multiple sugar transport system substrate-binding protein
VSTALHAAIERVLLAFGPNQEVAVSIRSTRFGALLTALVLSLNATAAAAQAVELKVDYPYPDIFRTVHEQIASEFMARHPDVKVAFRAPQPDYEALTQQHLRQATTGQLPDVAFHGLNRIRIFADRGLPVELTPLIAREKDWGKAGYDSALLALGQVQDKQFGLGFSLSTPILYYNADLVRKAGGDPDNFPSTWDGVIELARKIRQLDDKTFGLHVSWDITGNWMWQSLVFANGGAMLSPDEKKVAFDGAAGQAAIATLAQMVKQGAMRDVSQATAMQDFVSGRLGIWSTSTAYLTNITKQIGGGFALRTAPFPLGAANGRLPAGGNVAMIFSQDPKRQEAAWAYVKFATGPIGATIMVNGTGYFPANTLPANDPELLGEFYKKNPNHLVAIRQMPVLTGWYAFPGANGLKVTDVIKDHLQSVVAQSAAPDATLRKMASDVQALLPR